MNTAEILNELYKLRVAELERKLTPEESSRYLELYEECRRKRIEIPFGVEI